MRTKRNYTMRSISCFIFFSLLVPSFGQSQSNYSDLTDVKKGDFNYLLDSVLIDLNKIWLDPDNILKIELIKKCNTGFDIYNKGLIHIYSINKNRTWISLPEIQSEIIDTLKNQTQIVSWLIDSNVIKDTSEVKIEKSSILEIEILKKKDGIESLPSEAILIIKTKTGRKLE